MLTRRFVPVPAGIAQVASVSDKAVAPAHVVPPNVIATGSEPNPEPRTVSDPGAPPVDG